MKKDNWPEIFSDFDKSSKDRSIVCYRQSIQNVLEKTLPTDIFEIDWMDATQRDEVRKKFLSLLPLTQVSDFSSLPATVSFSVLYKYRSRAFKFFFEMINRWLVPGTSLNVVSMFACDFKIPAVTDDVMTLCDVMIHLESLEEQKEIARSLPIIDQEIRLGVMSAYNARRILEVKGLSNDIKTAMIQERISNVLARLPRYFDQDLMIEMQHLLVLRKDKFKSERTSRHLSKMICYQYLFRKSLREQTQKRKIHLKVFRSFLSRPGVKQRAVLSVVVGLNFLSDAESFEEKHLMKALGHFIPFAKLVDGSSFTTRLSKERFEVLYVELEKPDANPFSTQELELLKRELDHDIEGHIEKRMPQVFMPRNEEEIMRNILNLCGQLRFVRDIPQVFISFDEQSENSLVFTIILARVLKPHSLSVRELFKRSKTQMRYIHDRKKKVGLVRNKYEREATVFRVKLAKESFQRRDQSIDLYKARRVLSEELIRIIGQFRDYNGGMIFKQSQLLGRVYEVLGQRAKSHELLLENFFYSLQPAVMQTILEPEALAKLFLMLLEVVKGQSMDQVQIRSEPNFVYFLLEAKNPEIEDEIYKAAQELKIGSTELATSYIKVWDNPFLGYIYRQDNPVLQRKFCVSIENILNMNNMPLLVQA